MFTPKQTSDGVDIAERRLTLSLITMHSSLKFLSALTLSGSALLNPTSASAQSAPMAFECFERSSGALVARSAADITTPSLSCLPIPEQALYQNQDPEMTDPSGQSHAEANVDIHHSQPSGPNIGEIILGAAAQEGFRAIFGTYDRGNVTNNSTEIHNGDRCDGMATICGNNNGVGDVGSGNASNSGNTANSGNTSNSGNTTNSSSNIRINSKIPRIFPAIKNIQPKNQKAKLKPSTIKAIRNYSKKQTHTKGKNKSRKITAPRIIKAKPATTSSKALGRKLPTKKSIKNMKLIKKSSK